MLNYDNHSQRSADHDVIADDTDVYNNIPGIKHQDIF